MLKIVCIMLIFSIVLAHPEPPINSYLPPSDSYGLPGRETSPHGNGNGEGERPSQNYGPPGSGGYSSSISIDGNTPSNIYGGPVQNGHSGGRPSTSYGSPRQNGNGAPRPSAIYGAPGQNGRKNNGERRPSQTYGPPGQNGHSDSESFNRAHSNENRGTSESHRPSDSYGPPASGNGHGHSINEGGPSASYGVPGTESEYLAPRNGNNGNGYVHRNGDSDGGDDGYASSQASNIDRKLDDDVNNEPAKYDFSYEVEDAPSGLSFGHSEMRDGDFATGQYNVLLPDGRKQIVEYEADQGGYRPQVRYEGDAFESENPGDGTGQSGAGGLNGYDYNQSGIGHNGQDLGSENYFHGRPNGNDNGYDDGHGHGNGNGHRHGNDNGHSHENDNVHGHGNDNGQNHRNGKGYAHGNGNGHGHGNVNGHGHGNGNEYKNGHDNGNGNKHSKINGGGGRANGQNLGSNGYSSGRPNEQNLEPSSNENGYPNGQVHDNPSRSGHALASNGYPSGRRNGNVPNGNGNRKHNVHESNNNSSNGYSRQGSSEFGVGGQNGKNDGSGYQY